MDGKKTYLAAVAAIGYAVFAYLTGHADAGQAGQLIETAVLAGFIRHGIKTGA